MPKRKLTEEERKQLINDLFSDEDSEFLTDSDSIDSYNKSICSSNSTSEEETILGDSSPPNVSSHHTGNTTQIDSFSWSCNVANFTPKRILPVENDSVVTLNLNGSCTTLDVFLKLFPKSLFMQISHFTNKRLTLLSTQKKKTIAETCPEEIMIVLGSILIMSYNRVPAMRYYWSTNPSLGNQAIKNVISRDRFQILYSKLYFNDPEKPQDASKLYYIEPVLECLKYTFGNSRTESSHQSIDESMSKFKGHASLKQFVPSKPVKRGVKVWIRSDAKSGYVYDANIYQGKEMETVEGTLGERVVSKLVQSIKTPDVTLCFDRFFTTVNLLHTLPYPAVGICMRNQKNLPKFQSKLKHGESEMLICKEGMLACCWKDTKKVVILSNCHDAVSQTITRKMKDGSHRKLVCPDAVIFYNQYMGGIDLSDQMVTLYDLDRKSKKWWIKVFFRLMMTAVFNSYTIYCDVHHKKFSFLDFLVSLAESLINLGRSKMPERRMHLSERPSKKTRILSNIGDHLLVKEKSRRRCVRCSSRKKEKRTDCVCKKCNIPLCMACFTLYHT